MNKPMYGAAHPYDKQWREYRAWIRAAWLVWLGFLAVGLLVIIPRIEEHGQDVITRALSVLWFLAFGVIASHLGGWRCPRCDRAFFAWGPFHHLFARACIHCHLSKCAGSEWRPLG